MRELYAAAELERREAAALPDSPGMAERKRELERVWLVAERAREERDWSAAHAAYERAKALRRR